MSIEPSLIPVVQRLDAEEAEPVDWGTYRKCSQVCGAEIGEPCVSLSGRIIGGRPDQVRTALTHAHAARKRRTPRRGHTFVATLLKG